MNDQQDDRQEAGALPERAHLQYVPPAPAEPAGGADPPSVAQSPREPASTSFRDAFSRETYAAAWRQPPPAAFVKDFQAPPPPPPGPAAIIVCHGMGQQVRYETLGDLAQTLVKHLPAPNNLSTKVTLSRPTDSFIARAEISWLDNPAGSPPVLREVHLYEAYWAPLTEGVVTYSDTLLFLFSAAKRGILCSRFVKSNTFKRWMFGRMVPCEIKANTGWALLCVLLVLLLIVGLIFCIGLEVASQVKALTGAHLSWTSLWHFFVPFHDVPNARARGFALSAVFWVLVLVSYVLRYFIVQFVGDVAAYIAPFKASKFQKVRNDIQKVGFDVASLVYGFTDAPVPNYNKVMMVGHSLGSVLAYDTLNAMLSLDVTSSRKRDVIGRTSSLITFGSPLNKTAFLFRTQTNNPKDPLREQMAAASQPLIVTYQARSPHFKWINIYSPMDIISGALTYYDDAGDPLSANRKVDNRVDPQAWIPLAAHVQYWDNNALSDALLDEVRR